ncbi:hypothetical protein ACFO3D_13350 [Virgibacillus kekensis]|uniref:Uncharacterized protein n=1 Tax=Virgibacillus kekensis TaxID=202261 RepID=A0ABV9DLG3_9BACI
MKKNNNPELATFTLLNPDFHASVDEGAVQEIDTSTEEYSNNEKQPSTEPQE